MGDPRDSDKPEGHGPSRISAEGGRPAARILVVDDEPFIGHIVRDLLSRDAVETLTRPQAALERARGTSFDLVLCDLFMPEMSGIDLYRALERDVPALAARFVLMTGSATDPSVREFLRSRNIPLLRKPFRGAELERCVALVLDAHAVSKPT